MTTWTEEACPMKDDCPDPEHNHTPPTNELLGLLIEYSNAWNTAFNEVDPHGNNMPPYEGHEAVSKRCRTIEDEVAAKIEAYVTKAKIEELERLMKLHTRTYHQTVTDNTGDVYVDESHGYISKYETQERINELKGQNNG